MGEGTPHDESRPGDRHAAAIARRGWVSLDMLAPVEADRARVFYREVRAAPK